jgi:hypothetical protein
MALPNEVLLSIPKEVLRAFPQEVLEMTPRNVKGSADDIFPAQDFSSFRSAPEHLDGIAFTLVAREYFTKRLVMPYNFRSLTNLTIHIPKHPGTTSGSQAY